MNAHIQRPDGNLRKDNGSVGNITKCNKLYKTYKINEIVQNVNIVQFVTNFTKIKFLKKCKKGKNDAKCPRWTNSTKRHEEQEKTKEKREKPRMNNSADSLQSALTLNAAILQCVLSPTRMLRASGRRRQCRRTASAIHSRFRRQVPSLGSFGVFGRKTAV